MKNKKTLVMLGLVLIILLAILAIIIIKINMPNRTKEVIQEIGQVEQGKIVCEITERQEVIIEEPPLNVDQIDDEEEPEGEKEEKQLETPKYYIKVNNQANVVTIYTKDTNGNYTVPYKAMVCSIGTATPTGGIYTIPGKKWDRWTWGQMEGGVWAQYYVRIKGSILFHSVPYLSKDKSTLEYWEYDKLGTKASAGCIRLTVRDAKWIYDNCTAGTQVEFYYDSNPGPLGKPTAQKISSEESVRGWDPTDPSSENPWKNYVPSTGEEETPPLVEPPVEETPPVTEPPEEETPPITDPPEEEIPPVTDPPEEETPPPVEPPKDEETVPEEPDEEISKEYIEFLENEIKTNEVEKK